VERTRERPTVDLGPLPASIQNFTIYAIGLHAAVPRPEAAKALVRHLNAPQAEPAIRKMGMEAG
jgi:molybdate transport system substrate-binding protein